MPMARIFLADVFFDGGESKDDMNSMLDLEEEWAHIQLKMIIEFLHSLPILN